MSKTTTHTTLVSKRCPMCEKETSMEIPTRVIAARAAGMLIQNAWPRSTREDREFLQTGYCPACMALLFGAPVSERDQAQERAERAARALETCPDLTATVRTHLTIVTDRYRYSDQDAWSCTEDLERLARERGARA